MKNSIFAAFVLFFVVDAYACTEEQAFNKMMMLGRAQQQSMSGAKDNPELTRDSVLFAMEISNVGKILAAKKYNEACKYYDQIAAKYKIDFKEYEKDTILMKDIKKMEQGKKSGCTQADTTPRMMATLHDLEDKVALGEIGSETLTAYINESTTYNDLIYTNPGLYCAKIAELRAKYLK